MLDIPFWGKARRKGFPNPVVNFSSTCDMASRKKNMSPPPFQTRIIARMQASDSCTSLVQAENRGHE
jgi:hypothetical protein